MAYDYVIKNGLVVLPDGEANVDVAVAEGEIAAIGNNLEADEVVDADGLIVSPGMIDAHVHITEEGGGYRDEWEGYETGTRAAAKGGVTSFIEMPLNQVPATTNGDTLQQKYESGEGKLHTDVASFGGLVQYNLDNNGIQEQDEGGVAAYKAFLAKTGDPNIEGDFQNVDDWGLYEGLRQIAETGKILAVHAENSPIIDHLEKRAHANGGRSLKEFFHSHPDWTELSAIRKVINAAKVTGGRVHIVHVATPKGVELVKEAQEEGVDITCETCTHYLYFNEDEANEIGNVAKCTPPIRDQEAQDGLWEQLLAGDIDFVTSDHSPSTPDLKETDDAFEAWGGIAGVQNNVDVLFDEAVQKRGMSLKQFADITAANVADRYELDNKGCIQVGKDADFVFVRPNSSYTLEADDLEYKNKISPYVGATINAQVVKTILRGREVYSEENGVNDEPIGEFIKK